MNTLFKKYLLLIAFFSIFLSMPATAIGNRQGSLGEDHIEQISFSAKNFGTATSLSEIEIKSMEQAPAIEAFEIFCAAFNINQEKRMFPEGYGGAYISDDNTLVIKVLEGFDSFRRKTIDIMTGYDVLFEITDISCEELFALADNIAKQTMTYHAIQKVTISQKNSSIVLGIDSKALSTGDEIGLLSAIIKNRHIKVTESCPETASALVNGDRLYRSSGGILYSHGTMGYCGTYQGQPVVITAGHVSKNQTLYFGYSNQVGSVLQQVYYHGATGDYAIIKVNNTVTNPLTNQIYTGSGIGTITSYSTAYNTLDQQIVLKYGITTGVTGGTVTGYNPYVVYDDGTVRIYGLVEVTNSTIPFCTDGDSGGPVYRIKTDGAREALGIISGKDTSLGGHVGYYTPLYHISGFVPKIN